MPELDLDEDAEIAGAPLPGQAAAAAAAPAVDVDEDLGDVEDRLPDHAIVNDDRSVTLPLMHPQILTVKKDGKQREERFERLTFHRLNGADQRAIGAASEEMSAVVAFARSTRIMQAKMNVLFDKMDIADITYATRVLNSFLPSGRRTGRGG